MLLEEVGKRLCNLREILNESLAIACKTKKTAELLDIIRRFQFTIADTFSRLTAMPLAEMM